MRFEDMNLAPEIVEAAALAGWDCPTLLQETAIPPLLEGRDVFICQSTGAGKTAAYLLPLAQSFRREAKGGLRGLVLTPAGEHAGKVFNHCGNLCAKLGIACSTLSGEEPVPAGTVLALATPECLPADLEPLKGLDYFVLDGAEAWLKSAGHESLERIIQTIPSTCQRVVLTDAPSAAIQDLNLRLLRDPLRFPALLGTLTAYPVAQPRKLALLLHMVRERRLPPSLLLARSRHRADRLFRLLGRHGLRVLRIQGRAGRSQREKWMETLRAGQRQFLVASEMDGPSYSSLTTESVAFFDTPTTAGSLSGHFQGAFHGTGGQTLILVSPEEEQRLAELEAILKTTASRVTVDGFPYAAEEAEEEPEPDAGGAPPARSGDGEAPPAPARRAGRGRRNRRKGPKERGEPEKAKQGAPRQDRQKSPAAPPAQRSAPVDEEPEEELDEDRQPDFSKPLFPGQRTVRWNSFRLSLERLEGAPHSPKGQAPERPAADPHHPKPKKNKKKRGRYGSQEAPRAATERAATVGPPMPGGDIPDFSEDGDLPPETGDSERQPYRAQEYRARRFNRSAKYSSLAGAPPPPEEPQS